MSDPMVLIRAEGRLVALLAAMLHGAGVIPIGEFTAKLALYASVVSEQNPLEGKILAGWATLLEELGGPDTFSVDLEDGAPSANPESSA